MDHWLARVDQLDADIRVWLPPSWSMVDGQPVSILEDLMLRFEVPQQMIPTKTLLREGTEAGRLEPRGLGIIGANGRVDLISPAHHSIIVDRAESFEPSQWIIMPSRDRSKREPLTAVSLRASLG